MPKSVTIVLEVITAIKTHAFKDFNKVTEHQKWRFLKGYRAKEIILLNPRIEINVVG